MHFSEGAESSRAPNFAGVGVKRVQFNGTDRSRSLLPLSVNTGASMPTRSEWFPDQVDPPMAMSHSRLSCGRFPRFAKTMDNPLNFRIATPTPIVHKPRFYPFKTSPFTTPKNNTEALNSSKSKEQTRFAYSNEPLKSPTLQVSRSTTLDRPRPNLSIQPKLNNDMQNRMLGLYESGSDPSDLPLLVNELVPQPAFYHKPALSSEENLQSLDQVVSTPVPNMTPMVPMPSSHSSEQESRDIWDSATASSRSMLTSATSVDARSSPQSVHSKHDSPETPAPVPRQGPSSYHDGRVMRQSGLDAIDAFLWNTSGLCDGSDEDNADVSSSYSIGSYVTKHQTANTKEKPFSRTDLSELEGAQSPYRLDKGLPTPNAYNLEIDQSLEKQRNSSIVSGINEDDSDSLTIEQWIDNRVSTDSASTEVPDTDRLLAAQMNPNECRRCHHPFNRLKIRSADGKLSGAYHPECFHCTSCSANLRNEVFYVLRDEPFCYQHYHEKCNTLCLECQEGIEGAYRETMSGKFHVHCFTCSHIDDTGNLCAKELNEYYEFGGQRYCEKHAFFLTVPKPFEGGIAPDSNGLELHGGISPYPQKRQSVLVFTEKN